MAILDGSIYFIVLLSGTFASMFDSINAPNSLSCSSADTHSQPWLSFLCVSSSNSPFIGEYYPEATSNKTTPQPQQSAFLFARDQPRHTKTRATFLLRTDHSTIPLKLPRAMLQPGVCGRKSPVFFENRHVVCSRMIPRDFRALSAFREHFSLSRYIPSGLVSMAYSVPRRMEPEDEESRLTAVLPSTVRVRCFRKFLEHAREARKAGSSNETFGCDENLKHFDVDLVTLDNATVYRNVLVSLEFNFSWNETAVESVEIRADLINVREEELGLFCQRIVPPNGESKCDHVFIKQKFDVRFWPEGRGYFRHRLDTSRGYLPGDVVKIVQPPSEDLEINFQDAIPWVFGFGAANVSSLIQSSQETYGQCRDETSVKMGVGITSFCSIPIPDEFKGACDFLEDFLTETVEVLIGGPSFLSIDGLSNNETNYIPIFRLDSLNGTDDQNNLTAEESNCINLPAGLKYIVLTDRTFIVGAAYRLLRKNVTVDSSSVTLQLSIDFSDVLSEYRNISRFWILQQENVPRRTAWKNILDGFETIDELLFFFVLIVIVAFVFKPL
ncbi:unnamed protein product [Bemisia tabaci]|uniref:Tectonic-1-3 domain-containing protein n=1 Tax=Bemisia tabaci TaxID=7038 RepID=A0A9P0C8D6_BEMTA|nr:unnamed protein product [Bemisia tabaci]